MFAGKTFKFGEREFVIPPLSVRAMKELTSAGTFDKLAVAETQHDASVSVIRAAMARNYAGKDLEDLDLLLDVGNGPNGLAAVFSAVMGRAVEVKESGKGEAGSP